MKIEGLMDVAKQRYSLAFSQTLENKRKVYLWNVLVKAQALIQLCETLIFYSLNDFFSNDDTYAAVLFDVKCIICC